MADFSFDDYISNKRTQITPGYDYEGTQVNNAKLDRLIQAAKEKEVVIAAAVEAKKISANSWSSKLGVQNTPVVGTVVDLASSFASGASRQLGDLVGLTGPLINAYNERNMTDEDKSAIARFMNNTATPEDIKRIQTPDREGKTIASRYLDSVDVIEKGGKINEFFNIDSITNKTDRAEFSNDIASAYNNAKESFDDGDTVTGVAKLLFGAGKSILTNPKAVSEYIAENLPQLVVGGALGKAGTVALTTTNLGYAAEEYRKGVAEYMDRNNGALPPDALRNKMALQASTLAVAEHLGELGQLKNIGKAVKAAEESSGSALKAISKAAGLGFAEEAATEAYQTYTEGEIKATPATGLEIYESAVIGGASGGGLSGGGKAIVEAAEGAASIADRAQKRTATDDAVEAAIQSGDTTAIVDPESPTYAPHRIVDVAIHKALNTEVSQEDKTTTFEELTTIASDLQTKQKQLSEPVEAYAPQEIVAKQDMITTLNSEIESIDEMLNSPDTPEIVLEELNVEKQDFVNRKEAIEEELSLQKYADPKVRKNALDEVNKQLTYLETQRSELSKIYSQAKVEDTAAIAETITKPVDISLPVEEQTQAKQESVKKAITLAMANTGNFSSDDIKNISTSKEAGVAPEQQEHFKLVEQSRNKETAAKELIKGMKQVSNEVFIGEGNKLGIDQYRVKFAEAINSGDKQTADKLYSELLAFGMSHRSKFDAITTLMKNPEGGQIRKDSSGKWAILETPVTQAELRNGTNKGLAINEKSQNLSNVVKAELEAIRAFARETYSALNIVFPKAQESTTNVTEQSKNKVEAQVQTGVESSAEVSPTQRTEEVSQPNQSITQPTQELSNGTQTFETKQTEAQGQEQQTEQTNVGSVEAPRVTVGPDANSWVNTNSQFARRQSDNSGLTKEVESSFAEGLTSNQVYNKIKDKLNFVEGGTAEKMNWVIQVRATLGIPSQDTKEGKEEFAKWKQEYVTRNTVVPVQKQVEANVNSVGTSSVVVQESSESGYRTRTKQNADSAGVTVAIANNFTTAGERLTKNVAGNKYLPINLKENAKQAGTKLASFMKSKNTSTLNVAGNGIYTLNKETGMTQPEVNQHVFDLLSEAHKNNPITKLVSGGQTGVDIAGAVAARALGIPAVITLPKGFLQRGTDEVDRRNTKEAIEKQIEEGVAALKTNVATASPNTSTIVEGTPNTTTQTPVPAFTKTDEEITQEESTATTTTEANTASKPITEATEGKLSVLASEQYADTPIQQIFDSGNVVKAFIKQVSNGRPLVAVKDFFSTWKNTDSVKAFLGNKELSEKEEKALDTLRENIPVWTETLGKGITKRNLTGVDNLKDLFNQLVNDDNTVDQNLLNGMATAAYLFVGNYANYPETRTFEELIKIFHIKGKEDLLYSLSDEELAEYQSILASETIVINELGRLASDLLGFKNADQRVPANILPQLRTAMGEHILSMLVEERVIERGTKQIDPESRVTTSVVYFVRDEDGRLNEDAELIKTSTAGSAGILEKMFGAEESILMASTTPLVYKQKTTQNSSQGIADITRKVNEAQAKVPKKVIPSMYNLMLALGRDAIIRIAGGKDFDVDVVAKDNEKAVITSNNGLIREYDLMNETFKLGDSSLEVPDREFFTLNVVQKSGRVATDTRSINMTTSKIHRSMFYMPSWKVSLEEVLKDPEQYRVLMTSLGTYLGFNPDTTFSNDVVAKLEQAILQKPELRKAVNLVRRFNYPKVPTDKQLFKNAENLQAVIEFARGEDGMITLRALDTLSAVIEGTLKLQQNPDVPLNMEIVHSVGIDGKVSATGLTNVSYGTTDIANVGARTGFYSNILNGPKNFVEYANPGNDDQYQHLTRVMLADIMKRPDAFHKLKDTHDTEKARYQKLLKSFQNINGPLDEKGLITKAGRNLPKTPSTAFKFGSGIYSLIEKVSRDFIGTYNKAIEKKMTKYYADLKVDPNTAMPDSKQIIDSINDLITFSEGKYATKSVKLPYMTMEELLNTPLSDVQKQHVMFAVKMTVGQKMGNTFKYEFADYINKRNAVTKAADLSHKMYQFMYEMMKEQLLQEGMNDGTIAFTVNKAGRRIPSHDLPVGQIGKLERLTGAARPVAHTPFSKMENDLDKGIFLGKGGVGTSTDPVYENRVMVDGEIRRTPSEGKTMIAPGSFSLSALVHSLESSIMMMTVANNPDAHHVYDEILVGVKDAMATAKEINKHTAELIADYNPMVEVLNVLERSLIAFAKQLYVGENDKVDQKVETYLSTLTPKQKEAVKEVFQNGIVESIADVFTTLYMEVTHAESMKQSYLSTLGYVDQYPMEGGQHEVSDEMRQKAAKKANKPIFGKARLERVISAITYLTGKPFEGSELFPKQEEENIDYATEGEKQTSLKDALKLGLKATLDFLSFSQSLPVDYHMVFEEVSSLLPENLEIRVVNDNDVIASRPSYPVNGWFHRDGAGNNVIYINESQESNELIVHELLHAALNEIIEDGKTNDNSAATAFVDDLEALRTKLLGANPDAKFNAALSSIHELLSWGLTNREFQDWLKTVTYKSSSKKSLSSGFRDLVTAIKNAIFGTASESNTALEAVIVNFAGLTETLLDVTPKTGPSITLAMAKQNQQHIMSYTTRDIYDALGKAHNAATGAFDLHMRGLLDGIVNALRGPFGTLTEAEMVNQTVSPLDVWNKSLATGKAPLASKIGAANLIMSEQERFVAEQVEAVMQDALTSPEATVSAAKQELIKLHNFAKSKLSPASFVNGAWATASVMEQQEATDLYNLMFNPKPGTDGKSNYLSVFTALGLGSKQINDALNIPADRVVRKNLIGKNVGDTLTNIFEYLLNLYTGLATRTTNDMTINEKLQTLTQRLVDIEARKKNSLIQQANSKISEPMDAAGQKIVDALKKTTGKLLNSHFIRNNRFGTVQGVGAIARIFLEDRIPETMDLITKARNAYDKSKHGLVMNMMNDIRGYGPRIMSMVRNATALNAERQHLATNIGKAVLSGFADNGSYLTEDDQKLITAGLLRTGAYTLLNHYSMNDLGRLLSDSAYRATETKNLEKQLMQSYGKKGFYFIKQSKGLGYYMITGKSAIEAGQLKNALVISREALTGTKPLSEAEQQAAEKIIDQLSTLYSFEYMGENTSTHLSKLMTKENSRTTGNGFAELLSLQHKLHLEARDRLFSGSNELMIKGYMPEIVNPHTSFKIASKNEGQVLIQQGYEEHSEVFTDPSDPDADKKFIFVLRDGAPMPYVSGAVQLDSNKSKGTNVIGKNQNINMDEGILNASNLAGVNNDKRKLVAQLYTPASLKWDPRKEKGNYLIPLLSPNLNAVNWRYEMAHGLRDSMLNRDNRIDKVMGTLAATSFGKETAKEQNKAIVDALALDYKENYAAHKEHFIFISGTSPDKDLREIWNLIPFDMKQNIHEATGSNKGIWIRKKYVLPIFGYRKYSLSDIWEKDPTTLNHVEMAFKWVVEHMISMWAVHVKKMFPDDAEEYAKRMAYIITRRGQRGWEEVVSLVKDIIVIRTGTVMLGNIISNISLLKANGVPLMELMRNHHVAIKAYRQWDADSEELFNLKLERDLNFQRGDATRKEQRIVQLEDAINRSPIKKLIDSGLRPSIVEDLSEIDDKYSYKSNFNQKIDKYVDKINPTVRDVGKELLVTKNSKFYKALSKTTQMSDFVARYVLFEHLTKRAVNPVSDQDAIQRVSEAFINYDVPMDKKVQFMDDMGFIPFIKYFTRIQRVLLDTAKEHPLQMLSLVALNHFYSSLPLVTDSSFLAHIGNNPLRSGAGQIFTVWDETIVLDGLTKLVR